MRITGGEGVRQKHVLENTYHSSTEKRHTMFILEYSTEAPYGANYPTL